MIPTLIIPLVLNDKYEHYKSLAEQRAIPSIEAQTVVTPYIISEHESHITAKNNGVAKAGTEACMIMDADDILDPNFIRAVDSVEEWDIIKPRVYVNGLLNALPRYDIRKMNFLINGCPFKKWLWDGVGGSEDIPYPDWYIWAKMIIKYDPNIVYCRDAIYNYIQEDTGLNRNRTVEDMATIMTAIQEYEENLNA